jgi:hypothetical protein
MPELIGMVGLGIQLYADGCLGTMLSMSIVEVSGSMRNAVRSPQDVAARIEVR